MSRFPDIDIHWRQRCVVDEHFDLVNGVFTDGPSCSATRCCGPSCNEVLQLLFLGVGQTPNSLKHRRTPWGWGGHIVKDGLALRILHLFVRLLLLGVLVSHVIVGIEDPLQMVHDVG